MTTFHLFLLAFLPLCALGGLFARMDGGGKPATPEIVERLLCISFFVAAVFAINPWLSPVALLGMFGLATGHGQYFLSFLERAVDGERLDFIVRLVFGDDPRTHIRYLSFRGEKWANAPQGMKDILKSELEQYGRKKLLCRSVFGMFVTGSMVGLPAAIVSLCYGRFVEAGLLASTGLVKALAYYVVRPNTQPAEWINGTLRTALALVAICVSLFFIT